MALESTIAVINILDSRDTSLTLQSLEKNTTKKSIQHKIC